MRQGIAEFAIVLFCGFMIISSSKGESMVLENEVWRVQIEPDYGGRISSMYCKPSSEELVVSWKETKAPKRSEPTLYKSGGIFGGHQCGSYVDEQLEAVYEVLEAGKEILRLRWSNPYALFSGLEEIRTFKLSGASLVVNLEVNNSSAERRTIYYRVQDFIGLGKFVGNDAIYLYELPDKLQAATFTDLTVTGGQTIPLMNLRHPSYAIVNLENDSAIQVTAAKASLKALMFWIASAEARTAEFFFAPAHLDPGQKWQAELSYDYFQPSDTDGKFGAQSVKEALAGRSENFVYPQVMRPEFQPAQEAAVILPLHAAAQAPPLPVNEKFKSLKALQLFGTPGESVTLAFMISARKELVEQQISFSQFVDEDGVKLKVSNDPYYMSEEFMVRDFGYVKELPLEICNIKSQLPAIDAITPFSLKKSESVVVRNYLHIDPEAKAGDYHGFCRIGSQQFRIDLKVYPFQLQIPKDKGYGAFFRYMLTGDRHGMAAEWGVDRETYRRALEEISLLHWRNLVIYQHNPENILWVLDQLVELGWRDARFVLVGSSVSYAELNQRYGKYNFSFLPWGVDEPVSYHSMKTSLRKYNTISKRNFPSMNFSANTPSSLALLDILPKTEPTLAVTGNVMYFVEKTRELHRQNRRSFWYAGRPNTGVQGRLVRGLYVWKEPVAGMMDWGADTVAQKPKNDFHGFLKNRLVRTQRLENVRQATLDLFYLHTLEQTMENADPQTPALAEAQDFVMFLKTRFDIDHTGEARLIDHFYLDMLRQEAAELICKLMEN